MLVRYPDGSASWRCDRCGIYHNRRFVMLIGCSTCHPWGWSGDHVMTYCYSCVRVTTDDATGALGSLMKAP